MKTVISDELLNRYISGEATLEEIVQVASAISEDPELANLVSLLQKMNDNGELSQDSSIPMASMAAVSEGNLCDVLCEQFILKDYLENASELDCKEEMLDNCWLRESGTPLHNMGHLLEKNGMSVSRRYDSTISELEGSLASKLKLIAVVDYGQLWTGAPDGEFHAVVVINIIDGVVRIYDPAIDSQSEYVAVEFEKAWAFSKNYVVTASAENMEYIPHPINLEGVDLDESLLELTEAIAENTHEVWAKTRRDQGWRYGPARDDENLLHPDMVPYAELPESEKIFDRVMSFDTIRLVKKLGYNITRRYTKYCQHCGEYISDTMKYCPECGWKVEE